MNVIDKILSEWSYRCHDGIVDMNDPKKVIILNEILGEFGLIEEDIDDEILDLLDKASFREKKKILDLLKEPTKYQTKIKDLKQDISAISKNKKLKADLIQLIIPKNIEDSIARYIVSEADHKNALEDLQKLINSLKSLPEIGTESKLNVPEKLKWINTIIPSQASLGTGKGEVLLALMLDGGKLSDDTYKDIDFNGETIEVKQNTGIKSGAIISDLGRSDDYKKLWNKPLLNGQSFREKYNFTKLLSTWAPIFNRYNDKDINKDEYIEDLKKYMKEAEFSDVDILINKEAFSKGKEYFYKIIARSTVGDYLEKEDKILVLMNSNLEYIILDSETYKDFIISNEKFYANSSFSPRVAYQELVKDDPEEENKPKKVKEKTINISKEDIKVFTNQITKVKEIYVSKEWLDKNEKYKKYFNKDKSIIDGKYILLIPKNTKNFPVSDDLLKESLIKDLTNYLIKSFK